MKKEISPKRRDDVATTTKRDELDRDDLTITPEHRDRMIGIMNLTDSDVEEWCRE